MRKLLIVVMLGTLGLPTNVWCQEERSLAVLPIEGRRIDEDTTAILSELLVAHLSALNNRRLITMREVESMLGFETTKSMLQCNGGNCAVAIGGALGVDEYKNHLLFWTYGYEVTKNGEVMYEGRCGQVWVVGCGFLNTKKGVVHAFEFEVEVDTPKALNALGSK